jgi:hypothetical protein
MTFPFFMSRPLIGPRHVQCMGCAKLKISLFFSASAQNGAADWRISH